MLDGKILGRTALGRRTVTVDLGKYGYDADSATLSSSPFGPVEWTRVSGGAQLTLDAMPGLPSGTTVDVIGRFVRDGAGRSPTPSLRRRATPCAAPSTSPRKGTPVAAPVVPSASAASTAAIASGKYACALLSKAEATTAFGEPAQAPVPNGGRIGFQPTVDTSNCQIKSVSGNQLLQMTVYHGHSASDAAQYFELNRAIGTPVPGLESRAYSFVSGRTVWVLGGNDVVELNVLDQRSSDLPPALGELRADDRGEDGLSTLVTRRRAPREPDRGACSAHARWR